LSVSRDEARCPYGPTGYEGPGTSFSAVSTGADDGIVTFTPPIASGATAYFALAQALAADALPNSNLDEARESLLEGANGAGE
jgi:hypothetical protein